MSEPSWLERNGATPGKLALIGVLAVILVGVIVRQLPESPPVQQANSSSTTTQPDPQHRRPRATGSASVEKKENHTDSKESETVEIPVRNWPKIKIDYFLTYDPFATPEWLVEVRNTESPDEESARLAKEELKQKRKQEIIQALQKEGAKAIVYSGTEKRASIGEHTLRIGETYEGLKIIDITRHGIVLSETH